MHTIGQHSLNQYLHDSALKAQYPHYDAEHLSVSQDLTKFFNETNRSSELKQKAGIQEQLKSEIQEIKAKEQLIEAQQEQAIQELAELAAKKEEIDRKSELLASNLDKLEQKIKSRDSTTEKLATESLRPSHLQETEVKQ